MRQSVINTNRSLGAMEGVFGRLIALGSAAQIGKAFLDFEARMVRLQTDAGITEEQVKRLRDEITRSAHLPDIRVPVEDVERGVQSVIDLYGFSEDLVRNVETIARVIQATGAGGEASGAFIVELFKQGITDAKELEKEIDKIVQIGQKGSFVFRQQASLGPRLFTAIPDQAPSEVSALAQITRSAAGSSEQATTGIEALGRVFTDANKIKAIRKLGVQVFERDEGGKATTELRNINDILLDIIDKTKGNRIKISDAIGDAEAMRVFKGLLVEGNVELLKRLRLIEADGDALREQSRLNASTTSAIINDLGGKAFGASKDAVLPDLRSTSLFLDDLSRFNVGKAFGDLFDREIGTFFDRNALNLAGGEDRVATRHNPERLSLFKAAAESIQTGGGLSEFQAGGKPFDSAVLDEKLDKLATDAEKLSDAADRAAQVLDKVEADITVHITAPQNTPVSVTSRQSRGVNVRTDTRGQLMAGIGTR